MSFHDKKVCNLAITTLTCNDRETLFGTVNALLEGTILSPDQPWWILMQGCSAGFVDRFVEFLKKQTFKPLVTVKRLPEADLVVETDLPEKGFILLVSDVNLGLSKGNNLLCKHVKHAKYVLNVEDDWTLLPQSLTHCPRSWLASCVAFLDNHPRVSTLFLRKYATEKEKWQYGWTRVIPYQAHRFPDNFNWAAKMKGSDVIVVASANESDVIVVESTKESEVIVIASAKESDVIVVTAAKESEGIAAAKNSDGLSLRFQHIPHFLFTFNPTLRRNADYYRAGIYPLPEFEDVNRRREQWEQTRQETINQWGWCEALTMERHRDLITYNLQKGCFGHEEDWAPVLARLSPEDTPTHQDPLDSSVSDPVSTLPIPVLLLPKTGPRAASKQASEPVNVAPRCQRLTRLMMRCPRFG